MNDRELETFEAELRDFSPAKAPAHLRTRMLNQLVSRDQLPGMLWKDLFRWLIPAAGLATVALLILGLQVSSSGSKSRRLSMLSSIGSPLKADNVEIQHQFLTSFDALGYLPGGEPVRFRCSQWVDKVSVRNTAAGLVVERTTPRLEIVPVNYETY